MGTMADVARAAGVSVTTVSHVLNQTRVVSSVTREKVMAAINETGFRKNSLASALVTSKTKTIGLGISALKNPYFANLVHSIDKEASLNGYTIIMSDTHDDLEQETRIVESLLDRRVDGLILAPSPGSEKQSIPLILKNKTPLVLIDRHIPKILCDQVAPDNLRPSKKITVHLIKLGHRNLAVMAGFPGIQSTTERLAGFKAAMKDSGLEINPTFIGNGNSNQEDAYSETLRIFGEVKSRPSAVVVLNNSMTVGTMRGLNKLALNVPADVALVCYDDFEWADLFEPRLTAIEQNVAQMGIQAFDLLLNRISGGSSKPQLIRIPTIFHHRNSCGCVNQN